MVDITVRQALHDDLPALLDLLRQLFRIESDFQFDATRQEQGLKLLLEKMASAKPGEEMAQLWVAELESKVVAMCSVQVVISTAMGGESGLVEDLVVDASCRGAGVGTALLKEIESWCLARGLRRLQLLADRDNWIALEFYQRHGWRATQLQAWNKIIGEI